MQDRAVDPVVTHLVAGYVWLVRPGVGRAQDFSGMLQVSIWIQSSGSLSGARDAGKCDPRGFFPSGLNGVITTSSAPATEANLS